MVQIIKKNELILSIILRSDYQSTGIKFFTPLDFSQQLGYMNRPKGHVIPAHIHKHVQRQVIHTQEVLFIKSGKVRVDFFDESGGYVESSTLFKGDTILLASGGHGFEMLEASEIIEVKQGPYIGEEDKMRF